MHLDSRLAFAASLVRPGSRAADIGTDHAHLPVWLVSSGRCPAAIASDLRPGPVAAAKRTVAQAGLQGQIDIRLGDGLSPLLPHEADDIIIAGMGGETIAAILSAAPWIRDSRYHFILQPMTRAEHLHTYLLTHGFAILREEVVRDGKRLYPVISCRFEDRPADDDPLACILGGLSGTEADLLYLKKQYAALCKKQEGAHIRRGEDTAGAYDETQAIWEEQIRRLGTYLKEKNHL